jgi:hypothetical protein
MEKIVDEKKFFSDHKKQVHHRAQKDIFFIWLLVMFISFISAYFVLNLGAGSPTGFVTASEDPEANLTLLLCAFMVFFVGILITALIYNGITKKDHPY